LVFSAQYGKILIFPYLAILFYWAFWIKEYIIRRQWY